MATAKELETLFGISARRVEEIDAAASRGELSGESVKTVTGPGRPPLFDGAMQSVAFKEPAAKVQAINLRASHLGLSRSEYLRQLVDNDLECAGIA